MDRPKSPMSEKTATRGSIGVAALGIALNVAYLLDWPTFAGQRSLSTVLLAVSSFLWGWSRALRAHRAWLRGETQVILNQPGPIKERDLSRLIARSYNVARGR